MHSILKENHPPTVIDHAFRCYFFNDSELNLITAGATRLNIYRLYDVEDSNHQKSAAAAAAADPSPKTGGEVKTTKKKLEQVASFALFGNIIDMEVVRLGHNVRDSILLVFKDAKLSIVEYDPVTHDLKTDSMHFFENDEFKGGLVRNIHQPSIRVDPEHRCASMLIYGHHLVILPFKHNIKVDEQEKATEREHVKSVLPSYMIDLHSLDQPISNIVDFSFLHGYYEPTLVLLYEPVQTCSGRIAMRQDTFCIAAISLNMLEKVHPIIWKVSNLPFDCHMVKAIEKPLGGLLVFAANSLIYLNQSIPPYGVSLNSMTDSSTMFPLKIQENTVINLAEACADFMGPEKLIISLKGGEIYVLTLLTDGLRSIRSFHFDKAAGSVIASCVCCFTDGFVFLGSRLGNSLLLRYVEKKIGANPANEKADGSEPLQKKRKVDQSFDEFDDLEIFGDTGEPNTNDNIVHYTFDVSDSLLNIGPITKSAVGETSFLSEEFFGNRHTDLELVCCSGFGKNGALSVVQRSIRPQVVTTFTLTGCVDMWTVFAPVKDGDVDKYHSYLILSREDSTMVLKTGDEITEIDKSGFNAQYPTVYAGNLGLNKYIIQVCPSTVRLLDSDTELQEIPMDSTASGITACSSSDPHTVLLLSDGSLMYMQLIEDFNGPQLKLIKPDIPNTSKITSMSMYKDESGLFVFGSPENERQSRGRSRVSSTGATLFAASSSISEPNKVITTEDEEEMLYSGSSVGDAPQASEKEHTPTKRASPVFQTTPSSRTSKNISFWCFISRQNGVLEIYSVPDFQLCFVCNNFENAPKVVSDNGKIPKKIGGSADVLFEVKEILVVGMGHKRGRPIMFALMDQDIMVYECFPYNKEMIDGHLALRFKRLEISVLIRLREETKLAEMVDMSRKQKSPQIRVVRNVSSYETGVFICGTYPYWFFMTSRGVLNGHPLTIDGPILSFASFNNVNCPKGFLYFNKQGELRIAVLPTHLTYDAAWPVRKIPLRMTPYEIAYEPGTKVYAVAVAYYENHKKLPRFHTEEREFDVMERKARYIYPQIERFVIQLISPVSWEVIPNSRTVLQEFEHVTCMKVLQLQSDFVDNALKTFLVIGTTFNYGEDLSCKGRILVYDILDVVPEPGKPLTRTKAKCLFDKEQKGPVTAMCSSNGYLIAAVGQKIYAYSFTNGDLVGIAFVDSQVYTISLAALRNIIIAADLSRSISLIRFQIHHKSLALVSRDAKPLESYTAEFYIDGSQIGFLVSDIEQNLVLFAYQPEDLESFGGQRLLIRGDINVGSTINTMFRIRVANEEMSLNKNKDQRQVTILPTLDGSIFSILPLAEKPYRRLLMLQNKLVECLLHKAGLNPRAFRALHIPERPLTNPQKSILDGQVLMHYVHLSFQERYDIAKKMGTTSAQILDDLMDIERATSNF